MSADLCFTTDSFFCFSRSDLRGRWTELDENRPHMVRSKCNLKTHVQNLGYRLLLQIGGRKKHIFGTTSQLNDNFNGLYLRNETRCRQSTKCMRWQLQGVSYIVSKRHELWSNGLKLDRSFYPPSVNSAFHFIASLRRRRSANRTQPNFAKRWTVNRANNLP